MFLNALQPHRLAVGTFALGLLGGSSAWANTETCAVHSGAQRTPVIELYTSEGCSSCPPADQWFSHLKGQAVVAQAFHVGYWDYIGWVDRFAAPAHSTRQRELAAINHVSNIYTPQLLRNGRDWRDWRATDATSLPSAPARAAIRLQRIGNTDRFEAQVSPAPGITQWTAYWTVTENGHSSRVRDGENKGEFLQHDFVVRQYTPVGRYTGAQNLSFVARAPDPLHPRHINLVVSETQTGEPLQAVSLQCP